MGQRVAVTGSSGLIGGALSAYLTRRGDEVVRLVRQAPRASDEVRWDPASRTLDPAALAGVDAVVHLAGAGVGDHRWTPAYRREILTSRTDGTHAVADAVAAAMATTGRPIRLLSGSAMGVYGNRGDEVLTERSAPGTGFLTEVVRAWEASAQPAVDAGAPVAFLRSGLVLDPKGGAMERMLPLARLGLGGPLGSGRQWWSWITLPDEVRAIAFLLDHPGVTGPVNLVGPEPARQKVIAAALGAAVHRPAVLPAPAAAIRAVLGGFAVEVLWSKRVLPAVLTEAGFTFEHGDLSTAVDWLAR